MNRHLTITHRLWLSLFLMTFFNTIAYNQSNGTSLRSNITVEHVIEFPKEGFRNEPIRLVKDEVTGNLLYNEYGGTIWEIDITSPTPSFNFRYSAFDHNLPIVQGMTMHDDVLYLVGNEEVNNGADNVGVIAKGVRIDNNRREWIVIARTEPYLGKPETPFDHKMAGNAVSPDGQFIYVSTNSRTNHGEVAGLGREDDLNILMLKIPTNPSSPINLRNDKEWLRNNGYLYAEGIRNGFDMAFDNNGNLFEVENSGQRDDPEEMNWIREGRHYGFPYRLGGNDNPIITAGYNSNNDPLVPDDQKGTPLFDYDPNFPAPPAGVTFSEPIRNLGPDGDLFRDPITGAIRDASNEGSFITTFTAHRSPVGFGFDNANIMGGDFTGDAFMASFSGNTWPLIGGDSEDLLHMELNYNGALDNYDANVYKIATGFAQPIDIVVDENIIWLAEYGDGVNRGLWKITLPCGNPSVCGTVIPPTYSCEDINVQGGEGQIAISGLTAPNEIVQVFDASYNIVFRCEGGDCGSEQLVNNLSAGNYFIGVQFYDENFGFICGRDNVSITVTGGNTACHPDYDALVAIYNSMGSNRAFPNWNLSNCDVCTWTNIRCNANNRISELFAFQNFALAGTIPPEIGDLIFLESLVFEKGNIGGSIPKEMGQLTNLKTLVLSNHNITGIIPAEIGNLGQLELLRLEDNGIMGAIPTEIGQLKNLKICLLQQNQLTEIPRELGNLNKLERLSLFLNTISGNLPKELGNLSNLSTLLLSDNNLSGSVPMELGQLSNLATLELQNNQFSGTIPAELGNLRQARTITFNNNQLTGVIPATFGQLTNLVSLDLSQNNLSGNIPTNLGNLRQIFRFDLSNNQLSGNIPKELSTVGTDNIRPTNVNVSLNNNNLEGCFSPELATFCDLTKYDFSTTNNPNLAYQGDFSIFCEHIVNNSSDIGICQSSNNGDCDNILARGGEGQISIAGLTAPIEIVQVFDENYVPIFRCEGGDCGTEQIINDLSAGDYIVGVQFYTANWAFICERTNVKVTVTGNPPPPSESADCAALTFIPETGQISVAGLNTTYSQVQIIGRNTDWQVVTICAGDCQATQIIPNLSTGEYTVKVQLNASDGTDCYREEKVTLGGTPPPPPPPPNGNCEDLNVFVANSELFIQGLSAPIEIVQVFDENYQLVFRCQGADCGSEQIINNLAASNYFVSVQFYTADWKFICAEENILVTIDGSNTGILCDESEKDGFNRIGNVFAKEFYVSNNSLPIEDAKQACSNVNSRLATSLTSEEIDFIRDNINQEVFIDLSDASQEGIFKWANDRTYDTPIFDNNESNDLVFIAAWNDQLIATNNSVWKHFVCETPCAVSANSSDSRNAAITQLEQSIKLFPNPARSIINLQVLPLLDKKGTIQIFNVYGQLVQQFDQLHFKEAHQQLEIPNFDNGLYWLTIQAENMPLISKRFVVEHWK